MKAIEPAGYIFLCSEITEGECLKRNLFGGTEKYAKRVKGLRKGHRLYLFNLRTKKLHGAFEAQGPLKENIVPKAWDGIYPAQVRVKRIEEYKPISREDIGKEILKFDRTGKPSSRLTEEMVTFLEGLFQSEKRIQTYNDEDRYVTRDGHKVKSKAEQAIDDWLYEHRIVHGYEAALPEGKRCDFEIPNKNGKVYIEYWGLQDKEYLKNKKEKLALYKRHKLRLISLYDKDLKDLGKSLRSLSV